MGSADASPERAWLPHPEEQLFLDQLFVFMERFGRPINKVPNLGFKKSESRTDGGGPPSLPTLPPFLPLSLPPSLSPSHDKRLWSVCVLFFFCLDSILDWS